MADALSDYRRKRGPGTPEPSGRKHSAAGPGGRFVVHEHHARRLHWDLRLERDGVLASWAIPNGMPQDPDHNRKAIHVEDHPLEYIDFAGTIPQGSYGAGEVRMWDRGTYSAEKWEPGKVILTFHGTRLKGRYALFRAGRKERDWMIHRMDPPLDPSAHEMPQFVEPMLARLSTMPADQSQWAFEVKWDGVRAIARCQPGRLQLLTRNRNEVSAAYPELRDLTGALGSREAMLDGEIVAFDRSGRPSFQALQNRMHLRGESAVRAQVRSNPVTYMVFDLLWLDGHSLMALPHEQRRKHLRTLKLDAERWRTPAHHAGEGDALLAATREQGLEGVIAKRIGSPYLPGRRESSWLKIKNVQRQEVVIGGWTDGAGARAGSFGALELGVYDEQGKLRHAGKVGTGFDERELERLTRMLAPLSASSSPFSGRQPARGTHFVRPELVCEVEFSLWTKDGRLRQASYRGLREDKPPAEVVRERIAPPADATSHPGAQSNGLAALVAAGEKVRGGIQVEVEGRSLKLTNLEKVLYPATRFTKGQMIDWYISIAPALLAHLRDRPLTLKRYPNGVEGEYFYEKRSPRHRPDWVQTVRLPSESSKSEIDYTLCQDLPTLVWLANLADIELHPSLSRAQAMACPSTLAFDLDPGPPADILACCEVALWLREIFEQLGMRAFAKTSGAKGMQVYVPLNSTEVSYAQTKAFAHAVANLLHNRHPDRVVSAIGKAQRRGRVLVDWSQNEEHKTTISVYSLRAMERPTVSTPLAWEEVHECLQAQQQDMLVFESDRVLGRLADAGDLFAETLSLTQPLPDLDPEGD
jgi:bifunctional non-homologous end joining protein LigD